ncbi:hypothetical protein NA56DRAFT_747645 [Hyaloscypha hepaticicola]|uniref:Uncharacterized protein n=1 Tax=Hyaloscypha hepaticicola TaxID=2082293 RepID=A0A2J6Q9V4_9HELO|nr:hypothetical protein NA56DRAFT_747645 [Hyaloscypha hepaticicola]
MHLQPSKPSFVSVDFARPRLTSNGLGAAESLSGYLHHLDLGNDRSHMPSASSSPSTPLQKIVDLETSRIKAFPFATSRPPIRILAFKRDHQLICLDTRHATDYNVPGKKTTPSDISQSTLRSLDLLNPTSRWMSAQISVWLPAPNMGFCDLSKVRVHAACTTKRREAHFRYLLDAN